MVASGLIMVCSDIVGSDELECSELLTVVASGLICLDKVGSDVACSDPLIAVGKVGT